MIRDTAVATLMQELAKAAPNEWVKVLATELSYENMGKYTTTGNPVAWQVQAGNAEMHEWPKQGMYVIRGEAIMTGHRQWKALYYEQGLKAYTPADQRGEATEIGVFKSCNDARFALEQEWQKRTGIKIWR